MAVYGVKGTECAVDIGGTTYRSYAWSYSEGGNSIDAPAFEDAADETATIIISSITDLTINFRNSIIGTLKRGDEVTVTITIGATDHEYPTVITGVTGGCDRQGIGDFAITARVLPGAVYGA